MTEKTIGGILHRIQKELKAPKGQTNSFGNYKYRSAEDILVAVKACLQDDEFIICSDEMVMVGERYYVKAHASLVHKELSTTTTAFAREEETKKGMDAAQITGSASSYARKYALNGLFAIDDTKDADTMDNSKPEDKFTKEQKSLQSTLFTRLGQCMDEGAVISFMDQYAKEIESLPKEMSSVLNDGIENRLAAMKSGVVLKEADSHAFAGVDDAIKWCAKMFPLIQTFKSLKVLDMWESENRPFINGLDCLKADKYKKDEAGNQSKTGKSPKERLLDALMQKRVELENINTSLTPIG